MRSRRIALGLAAALTVLLPIVAGHGQRPPEGVVCHDLCRDRETRCRRACRRGTDAECEPTCEREGASCRRVCGRVHSGR
ncbi:MAG: hypothetical protein M3Y87_06990 [Myxococcota bacterium]|nr:hypothetical protein [Myxococcota bacterium]